ncbi:hypothetical protein LINGRAHAP2_LOCUS30395 [Linum grandiflorum]
MKCRQWRKYLNFLEFGFGKEEVAPQLLH